MVRKEKARQSKEEYLAAKECESKNEDQDKYKLFRNTLFLRIYDTTINQLYNNKLIHQMRFGQPLLVDCSYTQHMNTRECLNTAKQLMLLFAENRAHDQPFDLHYCNADLDGTIMKQLNRYIATLHEPWFPLNIHTDSYLDHFPKERLVYLTPHCRTDLEKFNHDDIYIIGAMVDKATSEPLSLGKAKEEGLRVAKLPLDRYLSWGSGGTKSLTLNQMCSIMLDLRQSGGDWKQALKHVPQRKVNRNLDDDIDSPIRFNNHKPLNNNFNIDNWGTRTKNLNRPTRYQDDLSESDQTFHENNSTRNVIHNQHERHRPRNNIVESDSKFVEWKPKERFNNVNRRNLSKNSFYDRKPSNKNNKYDSSQRQNSKTDLSNIFKDE